MTKRELLKTVANDLIKGMSLTDRDENDEKVPIVLGNDMGVEELETFIKSAVKECQAGDEFTKQTIEMIKEFGGKTKGLVVREEEPEVEEQKEKTLEQEIDEADSLKELKEIVQNNPEFKSIKNKLAGFKDADELKQEMLWLFTNAKVPKKPAVEQELPIEETQEEVAERMHQENIEKKPVKVGKVKQPVDEEPEEIKLDPDDQYPDDKELLGFGTMKTKDIKTRKPFNDLFAINELTFQAILKDMKENGFDMAFPIIVWGDIVIDGHTRLEAAEEAGIEEIPVVRNEFKDEREALEYAIHNQRDRRNISDAELLKCIEAIDAPMTKKEAGKKGGESKTESKTASVKSHKETAKKLGVGETKVTDARIVLKDEKATEEVKSGKKTISKAAKEIREHKIAGKPKSKKVEKKTRIDAICQVIKENADSDMKVKEIMEDADILFEEEMNGKSDMKLTEKSFAVVLEVLCAIGFVVKLDDETVKIMEL